MLRTTKIALALVGSAAAVALVAPASTASNTVAASSAGFGTSTISGATATNVAYTLSTDGTQITAASIVFSGNLTGFTVKAGFGSTAGTTCTLAAHNTTDNTTTASCTGYTQTISSASSFNVAVAK